MFTSAVPPVRCDVIHMPVSQHRVPVPGVVRCRLVYVPQCGALHFLSCTSRAQVRPLTGRRHLGNLADNSVFLLGVGLLCVQDCVWRRHRLWFPRGKTKGRELEEERQDEVFTSQSLERRSCNHRQSLATSTKRYQSDIGTFGSTYGDMFTTRNSILIWRKKILNLLCCI